MVMKMYNKITKNKPLGVLLFLMAVIGIAIIIIRLATYQFEFDAKYSPIDYGRFKLVTYFTIQSNFFACIYFIIVSLGIFGNERAQKIGFNSTLGALVTLYVFIAGVVYNAGFPMKMTPPLTFDTAYHFFVSFMQIYFHMIMATTVLVLWFFPFKNDKLGAKCILLSGLYPFVYSVFSIIRGTYFTNPAYYPYPFYNPEFVWQTFMKDKPFNIAGAYGFLSLLLVFGIGLFMAICAILVLIHNKRINSEA